MIESDVRILNQEGRISNKGRVEFRMNSIWGSVSARGMNSNAVKAICQLFEFNDGVLLNFHKKDSIEICKDLDGKNLCGSYLTPIHFMNMRCVDGEKDIFKCYRDISAPDVKHEEDAIIECVNKDMHKVNLPLEGSLRLMEHDDKITLNNKGRIEMFING